MHADQLRVAVDNVVNVLAESGVLTAIREHRTSRGDQRPVAAARLGHAGAMLMERWADASPAELTALKLLHLESMCEASYWQDLLGSTKPEKERNTELVQLYSRVLFASNHLPNFAALLGRVKEGQTVAAPALPALKPGEARMSIRLSDAGEKAADPDRIARSIDGVDMLYSACASLSRRPAIDLRLDHITGTTDRTIVFTGETESVSAMAKVIDSIPDALVNIADDQEIDLNALVQSLPIFSELTTLAEHGAFSENDLNDIRETMHQGALLTLESGVVLPEPPKHPSKASSNLAAASSVKSAKAATGSKSANLSADVTLAANSQSARTSVTDRDEHYERYLKEKASMQNGSSSPMALDESEFNLPSLASSSPEADAAAGAEREAAVEELLKNLNRQRDG